MNTLSHLMTNLARNDTDHRKNSIHVHIIFADHIKMRVLLLIYSYNAVKVHVSLRFNKYLSAHNLQTHLSLTA